MEKQRKTIEVEISKIESQIAELNQQLYILKQQLCGMNETIEESNDQEISESPTCVVPNDLKISGYEHLCDNLYRHINNRFGNHPKEDYHIQDHLLDYAILLSTVGRETLVIKNRQPLSEEEVSEGKSTIETWRKCVHLRNLGDFAGYEKYKTYLLAKFPIPNNPGDSTPIDFAEDQSTSLFCNSANLLYFLCHFAQEGTEYNNKQKASRYQSPYIREIAIPSNDFFSEYFIGCLEVIFQLACDGYSLAVVPIQDADIQYRSKSSAQDGTVFSFLYHDEYVDDPQMVSPESVVTYQYRNSTVVSGHYRCGHMRNGHWVNGCMVRTHSRK